MVDEIQDRTVCGQLSYQRRSDRSRRIDREDSSIVQSSCRCFDVGDHRDNSPNLHQQDIMAMIGFCDKVIRMFPRSCFLSMLSGSTTSCQRSIHSMLTARHHALAGYSKRAGSSSTAVHGGVLQEASRKKKASQERMRSLHGRGPLTCVRHGSKAAVDGPSVL